jgi:Ca-activated chloride channel family protein
MKKRSWVRATIGAAVASSLLALAGPLAPGAAAAPACTPKTNIEAIIDDSGSMAITDPNKLRVQGLDVLIDTLPASTALGAVEFGGSFFGEPSADSVFKPEPVGPNGPAMKKALSAAINADNGGTDYNAAFAASDAENPTAQARIFLTDGGHDVGTYNNGHLTHNVPTYVIGFGAGLSIPEDQARLQAIATETGGHYYPLTDSSQLQAVMNSIGAELTCQTPPRTFTDKLAQGKSATHVVTIGASTKTVQIALTWASPLDKFKLTGISLVQNGKPIAVAGRPGKARKPRKLNVKRHGSTTFLVAEVGGLSKGNLKFKVQAATIGSGEPQVTLTTQVGQKKKGS